MAAERSAKRAPTVTYSRRKQRRTKLPILSLRIIRLLLPVQFHRARNAVILAREDVILPQREPDPVVGAEDPAKVRVAVEEDPEHVVRLPLVPIRGLPDV